MCTEEQHSATLAALSDIQKCLTRREAQFKTVPVSDVLSFVVDYQDRQYLFAWSATALTLSNGASGTFSIPAETWYPLQFRPGDQITTSGYSTTTTTKIFLMATDDLLPLTTLAMGAGSNIIGKVSILDSSGNVINFSNPLETYAQLAGTSGAIMSLTNPLNALVSFANNNASVPTGAGNTVVKNAPGSLATLVVTAAGTGTGNVLLYDNASTNSGTVLFAFPATISVAQSYQIYGWAKNGITAQNVLNGPVFTVYYS